ncbi:peptidoglycan-binding protein [Acetobacterium bakii]|uniref:peptidoglycan-binding protein n=1 Tax=Acetobacterium bakii TaxID=52689 RepID=UPI00068212EE|nr:peptidoglycan-binding protein [Acetobacterium bakii]
MDDYIKWIQETLTALGYDPGPVDGINGVRTETAVKKFQTDYHLKVDGMVGDCTHDALSAALNSPLAQVVERVPIALKNFTPDEFKCYCGCGLDVCEKLKGFAQNLRDYFGWPLVISSGARCPPVNRAEGGVPDSCHLTGEAFDGYFPGHMNEAVMQHMADFAVGQGIGVIRYPNQLFCHFQVYPRNSITY